MLKNKVLVRQADGSIREVHVSDGGKVSLRGNEQLLIAAAPEQAEVRSGGEGKVAIRLEGIGEFTVESEGLPPEALAMGPDESPVFRGQPVIVFERAGAGGEEGAVTHEPLGVHEASVADTTFLDQQTGEDFGMGRLLGMAAFSAEAGGGLAKGKVFAGKDEDGLLADALSGDSAPGNLNLPPVIDINNILLVDDDAMEPLTGHLRVTDRESGPGDLLFRISQGPASGTLYIDGKEVEATKVTFTQADIDSGRVTFRFDPHAQDGVLVLEDDTFVFTVTDGTHTTGPATFHIQNSTVQVWGTDESDDLTGVAHFDRDGVKFHVYGFEGNDILRGGSGADTLDGGGHSSTGVSYSVGTGEWWEAGVTVPGATPGGDTVDYGASNAAVDVDLQRARQLGGHAEDDVLRGIENVVGSRYADTLRGDGGNNVLAGQAGADLLDGRGGLDTADYRRSDAAVDVDLTRTGTQSGGHAEGDTLVSIENVIGSAFADSIAGDVGDNFLDGGAGDDTLLGGAGYDTLRGGSGADSLDGGANNRDLADYSTSDGAVNVDLTRTGAQSGGHAEGDTLVGIEDVLGSRFNDVVTGNDSSNLLFGGDGDDTIFGGGRNDTISGGAGNDWIAGGTSEDDLYGGAGNDTIFGGNGYDTIFGGDGDDYLVGYNPDGSADTAMDFLVGGAGNDTLDASHETRGSRYKSTLIGGMGADMLIGNGTSTIASYELTGHVNYEFNFGPGVYLDLRRQGKDADGNWLAQIDPEGRETDAVGDTLIGIVNVIGTWTHDTLIGNHQDNVMYGLDGNDLMIGNEGNDTLWGYDHNDTLEGGAGADYLWGGQDFDMVSYEHASQGVSIDLRNQSNYGFQSGAPGGEEVGDQLWYVDGVIGSAHDDTLIGSSVGDDEVAAQYGYRPFRFAANRLEGGAGDDLLMGLGGADTLDGGEGKDTADYSLSEAAVYVDLNLQDSHTAQTGGGAVTVTPSTIDDGSNPGILYGGNHAYGDVLISIENLTGSAYHDTLIGNGEDNVLSGLAGDDSLIGDGGNDTLIGGAGNDTLQGGDGADLIRAGAGDVVDGGAGHDVLVSEDEYLDVNSSTTITGIERIDLAGACKGLTVSGAAILSNGVADPAGSGLMALMVTGDAGDSVARLADGGWTWTQAAPEVTVDGQTYVLYEAAKDSQTVRLYVQTGLNEAEVAGGVIQIWGTEGADDLTTAWDFNDPRYTFQVYGLDGNDTMRGGSGADTLDGGGHAYAALTPWLYTQEGGDTVDYGASTAAVDIDLTRATQSGGHAEGDVLIGVENVIGSGYGDSITGDAAANLLAGLGGNDTLLGGDGNDTLRGGAGADLIDGGLGLDFADYRDSASWVAVDLNIQDGTTAQSGGGTDNDALGDTLIGIEHLIGSNNASHGDVLTGNAAGNHLIGLDGDDTLVGGAGNDTLVGGAGADVLSGGSGTRDLADYSASTAWVNVDLTRQDGTAAQTGGGAGNHAEGDILTGIEDVNGSAYADSILGNTAINVLYGYGGNDTIFAGNGNDTVHGGDGDDFIDGGRHADELFGDSGNDTIYGGDSIDTLFGGAGDDVLYGYRSDGGSDGNQDLLLGGTGNDTLVSLSTVRSKLVGCQGADRIMGGGIDYVSYELTGDDFTVNRGESVYVDLRIQDGVTAQSGGEDGNDAIGDVLTGIRHILGTYGMTGDTLIGNDEANEIYGLDGHDLLVGGGGNDTLWGNDHNDTLEGGAGADMLWGGMHYDMVSYEHASQGVSIDLSNQSNYGLQSGVSGGEEVGDQLWYIDGVIGSAHDDTLIGSSVGDEAFAPLDSWAWRAASNRLEGGSGDDLLMGLGAPDTLDGGEGIDTADYSLSEAAVYVDLNLQDSHTAQTGGGAVTVMLSTIDDGTNQGVLYGGNHAYGDVLISIENLTGSTYNDTLIGNGGDNVLSGLAGNDSLVGGGGDDTLVGGAGNDTLQGGDGDDLIRAGAGDVVNGGAGHDVLVSEDEYLDVNSSTTITGIERIDLTGACKGLTVSGAAILSNGVADPAGSGLMALMVTGDAGDSVARLADGGWTWTQAAPEVTVDGQTYVLYEAAKDSQTVRLYVQTGLNEAEVAGGAIQIWGTEGADDLTTAWDFNDPRYTFQVYGLDGNDTMRGGSGADTLDGGGHAYAALTPWLYTQEGGDTVDYGASTAAVDIDLTRATQSGGHAEGDVLIGVENVIGSGYGDSITGDAAANLLAGLGGNDTLLGGDGNDTLRGGAGADLIDGGLGLDFADYRDSASWVAVDLNIQDGTTAQSGGGTDNDALGDTLIGIEHLIGSNNASHGDVLTGNAAGNHLIGLDGDDTLVGGAGNDTLVGGAGADVLSGGSGTRDLADYSASTAWVNVDLTRQDGTAAQTGGGAGNHAEGDILTGIEDVNGSAYADSILGNTAINVLYGYGGNDTIFAGNGNDTVHGGDGDDFIDGGRHADELFGDSGNDTIYGGDSIDTLFGGAGDDVLYGYRSDGGSDGNQDLLLGGTGNDTLVSLSTVRSKLVGCQGADRIMGGGIDYVSYELTGDGFTVNRGESVYVDLRIQDGVTAQSGGEDGNDAIGDVLTGIRHILGTYGMTGDTLIGNDEANEIYGLDGHDLLVGGGGNDTLWGNDHNDTLEGGAGADMLWGGMHYDMVSYEHASQGVSIDLSNQSNYGLQSGVSGGEEVGDQLWYIDGVIGSAHDDTLIGSSVGDEAFAPLDSWAWRAASNRLEGGSGDDLLMGLGAPDTLDGGEGIDTADYSLSEAAVYVDLNLQDSHTAQTGGGAVTVMLSTIDDGTNQGVLYGGNHAYGDVLISIENLTGSTYNDTLIGNGGDNVLSGLAGNDSLVGGGGNDTLIGGDGNDLAVGGFMDSVDGGNGFDTFRLDGHAGTGSALDLTAMNVAGRITGFERIDIAGDADDANTLTLKASDVLDTTGGTDTLWVHGDGNDTVTTTDTGWTHVGVETGADGQQYDHYSGNAGSILVNLMIDTDIANQNVMHA